MSDRKLRWLGLGLVATAGAGVVGLSAMMNPAFAHADNIGLVIGGTEVPIPGPAYVAAADELYLDNGPGGVPTYPDLTFYQATPATDGFGNGLFTPEGAYPLFGGRRPAVVLQLSARFRWPCRPQHLGGPGRRHPGKHDPRRPGGRRRLNGVRLLAEFHALRRHDAATRPEQHAPDGTA